MEFVSIREFKTHATRLMKEGKTLLVMRNGRPAGFFIPWEEGELSPELKMAVLEILADRMAREREKLGISEDEVIEDFKAFKNSGR